MRSRAWTRWQGATAIVALGTLIAIVLCLLPAATAAAATTAASSRAAQPATSGELDRFVRQQKAEYSFPGLSVAVIRDGDISFERSYGSATPGGSAVTPTTPFVLGSTSKQFTGLAIQQLIARGQLELGSTVGELMASSDGASSRFAHVTVAQLLSHRSGLSYITGNEQWDPFATASSVQAQARVILRSEPVGAPGARYVYSNANYTLLGAIIENLTQESYSDALHTLVTDPLGLESTTADLSEARAHGLATGTYRWFGAIETTTPGPDWPMAAPSAYITSSTSDLVRLLRVQLGAPSGVGASVLAADRAPLTRVSKFAQYGSGWFIRPFWELHDHDDNALDPHLPKLWEHDGDAERFQSYLAFSPDRGFGLAVVTNSGLGIDRDRWSRFTYALVHKIIGTQATPWSADPIYSVAPLILLGLPGVLLGTLGWLMRAGRRRSRSRVARVAPLVLGVFVAALTGYLVFVFVPSRTFTPVFDRGWWTGAPDFSAAIGLAFVLSIFVIAALVAAAVRVVRRRREGDVR